MKFSELKGRAVVNLEDAKKIGEVEDLMIEPDGHHIVSLKVKSGLFSSAKIVPVADVKSVGADAVTIVASAGTTDPQTNMSSSGSREPLEVSSILGNKVVTDAGTLVGELRDVLFDWTALTITGYEVREGGLFAKAQEFAASPDIRYGNKIITIPAQLLNQPA